MDSPIDDALAARRGVCQDFAHVMIALVRRLGVPCRYVSGYIAPRPKDDRAELGRVSATHAWVEALLPGLGWVGLDPTNNVDGGDSPHPRGRRPRLRRRAADARRLQGRRQEPASSPSPSTSRRPAHRRRFEPMLPEPQWTQREVAPLADADLERENQKQQQQQQQ